jgi:type VI secretion system protein ImpL
LGQTAEGGSTAIFQILPGPATGFSEYTLQIGDQLMRYRNTPAQWSNFSWDSNKPNQVAKVSVVTFDGRTEDIKSFIGQNALGQLIKTAQSQQNADGSYELAWTIGEWSVPVSMKIVSNPRANADGSQRVGLNGTQLPSNVVGVQSAEERQP